MESRNEIYQGFLNTHAKAHCFEQSLDYIIIAGRCAVAVLSILLLLGHSVG